MDSSRSYLPVPTSDSSHVESHTEGYFPLVLDSTSSLDDAFANSKGLNHENVSLTLPSYAEPVCTSLDMVVDTSYKIPVNSETLDDIQSIIGEDLVQNPGVHSKCELGDAGVIVPLPYMGLAQDVNNVTHLDTSELQHAISDGYVTESTCSSTAAGHLSPDDAEYTAPRKQRLDSDDSHDLLCRPEKHFWRYNRQSKGPKGLTFDICIDTSSHDTHEPVTFVDPVFDAAQSTKIDHVGKARKGEGNDVLPNPEKLYMIGCEVSQLTEEIKRLSNSLDPSARREKSNLASRVCRLKKKANNEANKIILHYLQKEHGELKSLISQIRQLMQHSVAEPLLPQVQALKSAIYKTIVAGRSDEFVGDLLNSRYSR